MTEHALFTWLPLGNVIRTLREKPCLLVLEDCVETGSLGQRLSSVLAKPWTAPSCLILRNLGDRVPDHGTVSQLYEKYRLNAAAVAADIEEVLS